MATQEQSVSKENLDQISTGTFAVDVANYRSILLKYEKEINEVGFDSKRAAFILREVTGMQEVVFDRINRAGRDARRLGVPPEEIEQSLQIYRRTLAAAAFKFVGRYEYVFGRDADTFLDAAKLAGASLRPEVQKLANDIRSARLMIDQILRTPDTAFMIFPVLVKSMTAIEAVWKAAGWSTEVSMEKTTQPPGPPAPPPSGGAGDGADLPRRVDRLESKVDKMSEDIGDIKVRLGRMEERLTHVSTKADVADAILPVKTSVSQINERLTHVPTKFDLVKAAIAIPGITWLVSKYADPLVAAIGRAFAQ